MRMHIDATWRIRLNDPRTVAVRSYVVLLWQLVSPSFVVVCWITKAKSAVISHSVLGMFLFLLLVPAYPGCPGSKAVKSSLLLLLLCLECIISELSEFILNNWHCPHSMRSLWNGIGPQRQTRCCRFAAVGPACRKYRSVTAVQTAAAACCGRMRAVPRCQRT